LLRNPLHTGGVVVTGPSGTLGLLKGRTRSGLVEKPGNEHRTPRSTVHPVPTGNGIRVISTALGVFTDALLSERDDVTGRTLTATDVLVLLLLKVTEELRNDGRHKVVGDVGQGTLAEPVLQSRGKSGKSRLSERHEATGKLTLSLSNELVDLTEDAALGECHGRGFAHGSGLTTDLLNLVGSLRVWSKRLLNSLRPPLPGNRIHPVDEIRSNRLRPLGTHDGFAARESNRTTRPRNGVHIPPRSVARQDTALSEPLLTELDLLQFRKSWNNASDLPINGDNAIIVNRMRHELHGISGDLFDLVPDLLDAVLHACESLNSLLLHVVPDINDGVTGTLGSRDDPLFQAVELVSHIRNPPRNRLIDGVLHVGKSLLDRSNHRADS